MNSSWSRLWLATTWLRLISSSWWRGWWCDLRSGGRGIVGYSSWSDTIGIRLRDIAPDKRCGEGALDVLAG